MTSLTDRKRDLETLQGLYAHWERGDLAYGDAFTDDVVWAPRGPGLSGRSSGVETEGRTALVITMRDGRIARMDGFWDRDAALREAGLEQ